MNLEKEHSNYLVSVITPAYNCERYIEECISSVLNQTYQKWEMIIVNDNSTDNTRQIVERYLKTDPRIKLYNQKVNMGAAAARNKGIELAEGRFVAFLDSDDMWKPQKLELQIPFMLENNYGFTFTAYESMKGINKKVFKVPLKLSYDDYLKNTIIGCLTVVMDREIIGEIKFEYGHLEDVLTWMKYLKEGFTAYGLDCDLATYRVLENSVSSNKLKNAIRYYTCLRKEQELSLIKSVYCEISYLFNAIKKRYF